MRVAQISPNLAWRDEPHTSRRYEMPKSGVARDKLGDRSQVCRRRLLPTALDAAGNPTYDGACQHLP
jgi:hypothetical protein